MATMDQAEVIIEDSKYCRKCASCRSWIRCDILQALQQMFVGFDGKRLKSCKRCRDNRGGKKQTKNPKGTEFDLVSLFMELHDNHGFEAAVQPLRMKVTLTSTFLIENDICMATCAQSGDQKVQRRAALILRNDIFDCSGYFFHLRRTNDRPDGARFNFTCSRSIERKTERDFQSIRRYTGTGVEFPFDGF
ncbi:hypothetical protein V1522DRAFT_386389 [Lipomyces starkeyi]